MQTSLSSSFLVVLRYMWHSILNYVFFWQGGAVPGAPSPPGNTRLNPSTPPPTLPSSVQVDYDPHAGVGLEGEAWAAPVEAELERLDSAIGEVRLQLDKALAGRLLHATTPTDSLRVKLKSVVARLSLVLGDLDSQLQPESTPPTTESTPLNKEGRAARLKRWQAEREELQRTRLAVQARLEAGGAKEEEDPSSPWLRNGGRLSGRKRAQRELVEVESLFPRPAEGGEEGEEGGQPRPKKQRSISKARGEELPPPAPEQEEDWSASHSGGEEEEEEDKEKKRKKDIAALMAFGGSSSEEEGAQEEGLTLDLGADASDLLASLAAVEGGHQEEEEDDEEEGGSALVPSPPSPPTDHLRFDAASLLASLGKKGHHSSDEEAEEGGQEEEEVPVLAASREAKSATKDLLASLDRFKGGKDKKATSSSPPPEPEPDFDLSEIDLSQLGRKGGKGKVKGKSSAFDLLRSLSGAGEKEEEKGQKGEKGEKEDSWSESEEEVRREEGEGPRPDRVLLDLAAVEDLNKAGMRRGKKGKKVKLGGGKESKYEQEDAYVAAYPWQEGGHALLAVFDGHAGKGCSTALTTLLPRLLADRLPELHQLGEAEDEEGLRGWWERLFEAADEELKEFEYEGATGTVVLLWRQDRHPLPPLTRLQVANVGDSAAFLVRDGSALPLTEEHKPTLPSERRRIQAMGVHLEEGQSRLNGLAVSRAFGNHFPKEMKCGMVVTPYVSPLYTLTNKDSYLILASDGLWDVVSGQRAADLVRDQGEAGACARKLLRTALDSSKCTDNVTVLVARL